MTEKKLFKIFKNKYNEKTGVLEGILTSKYKIKKVEKLVTEKPDKLKFENAEEIEIEIEEYIRWIYLEKDKVNFVEYFVCKLTNETKLIHLHGSASEPTDFTLGDVKEVYRFCEDSVIEELTPEEQK